MLGLARRSRVHYAISLTILSDFVVIFGKRGTGIARTK